MACYSPINCWRHPDPYEGDGPLHFQPQPCPPYERLQVPCGKCTGCRADQSLMWSIRAYHESTLHLKNSFLTLTYSDNNLPSDGKIVKRDLQLFFKRLRKQYGPKSLRYIACGEYGDVTNRPHYHAIIFGQDFRADKIDLNSDMYTSPSLAEKWGLGNVSLMPVTMASICYVCGYVFKKNDDPDTFSLMSRRPGIGHDWLDKYRDDLRRTGTVTIEGKEYPVPPRYLDWEQEFLADVIKQRQEFAKEHKNDPSQEDRSLRNKEMNHRAKRKTQTGGKL